MDANATTLLFSTFLGGNGFDDNGLGASGISLDSAGNVSVSSATTSTNFPITADAAQSTLNGPRDAFVTTLNSTLSSLVYSTYVGGSGTEYGNGFAGDAAGNLYGDVRFVVETLDGLACQNLSLQGSDFNDSPSFLIA